MASSNFIAKLELRGGPWDGGWIEVPLDEVPSNFFAEVSPRNYGRINWCTASSGPFLAEYRFDEKVYRHVQTHKRESGIIFAEDFQVKSGQIKKKSTSLDVIDENQDFSKES
jgi:hypothetical protein